MNFAGDERFASIKSSLISLTQVRLTSSSIGGSLLAGLESREMPNEETYEAHLHASKRQGSHSYLGSL